MQIRNHKDSTLIKAWRKYTNNDPVLFKKSFLLKELISLEKSLKSNNFCHVIVGLFYL